MTLCIGLAAVLALVAIAAAETAVTDDSGRVSALVRDSEYVDVATSLRIPLRGWGRMRGFEDARDVRHTHEAGHHHWSGRIEVEPGKTYRFEQDLVEVPGGCDIGLRVTAYAEADIEGVYLFIDVPVSSFRAGSYSLWHGDRTVSEGQIPIEKPAEPRFGSGEADHVSLADASGDTELTMRLGAPLPITIQDSREWGGSTYTVLVPFASGPLQTGATAELALSLRVAGRADHAPVDLHLDADQELYRLDGFGGNYCFGIESPITDYTLTNLRVAWARTEITLDEWEPERSPASSAEDRERYRRSQDREGSNLRREFELAARIQGLGVPYVSSIWHLPEWLYADSGARSRWDMGRRVPRERWPDLVECLGSYLEYQKERYGAEPDLFSFNEANIGVMVTLTPEEHRDLIKAIGADLARRGLRTKQLLGDVHAPRYTHDYVVPASEDPEAMQYVGALAFHSWGGATPEEYAGWGELARRLGLPLLVAELGVDAAAWRTRAFDTYHYAMREVRMYQELLLHAHPQGTMQWEFTNDYGILREVRAADGSVSLEPTARYHFVRQFCNLTPTPASCLLTASTSDRVLFTAFRGNEGEITLHIANCGAERQAYVSGLPTDLAVLRCVRTTADAGCAEAGEVSAEDGLLAIELPAQSLTTLTTRRGWLE